MQTLQLTLFLIVMNQIVVNMSYWTQINNNNVIGSQEGDGRNMSG